MICLRGMDAVIIDYVPKALSGAAKGLSAVVHVATVVDGTWLVVNNISKVGGLLYFNMNDVGICEGVKMLWAQ